MKEYATRNMVYPASWVRRINLLSNQVRKALTSISLSLNTQLGELKWGADLVFCPAQQFFSCDCEPKVDLAL